MYYLKLKFKNAKLFISRNTKDFTFDIYGEKKSRDKNLVLGESIHVNHISNVLHVLFGERPVPSLRASIYNKSAKLNDLALNSYIKIDNYMINNTKNNTMNFVTELTQTKKAVFNSYNPAVQMNWNIIENYFGEYYDSFIEFIENLTNIKNIRNNYSNISLIEILKPYNTQITNYIKPIKKSALNDYLLRQSTSEMVRLSKTLLTINRGIDTITKLHGEILIPLSDDDLELFENVSTGTANILDGGLVYIEDLLSDYDISTDEIDKYKKVSELK